MNDYLFLKQLKRDKERYQKMLWRSSEKDCKKLAEAIVGLINYYEIIIEKTEKEMGLLF
jgi:hypothetical protein